MRRPLLVLALGVFALWLQGAFGLVLGIRWIPDFGLLVPIAAALTLGPAEGLLVAAGIGLTADMLSGSLLGQHALLRVLEFVATRAVSAKLDLRRPLPLAVFVLVIGVVDAAAMAWLTLLFLGDLPFSTRQLAGLVIRSFIGALFAPAVAGLIRGLVDRLGEFEARREVRLDTKRPAL